MSFDISMRVEPCHTCGQRKDDELDLNVTYNIAPMFVKALGKPNGIRHLHTMAGAACLNILDLAIKRMKDSPGIYESMNPKNGWGNAENALVALKTILGWCEKHPDGIVYIN